MILLLFFFFQAEDGIRDGTVTGVQTCALPISGDRYLLCSDGLSGVVSDETLRETMAGVEDPEAVTRQLIELALHGGGPDNITCIVADVVDTAASRVSPTGTPVLAGAAANVHDSRLSTDGTGPFGTDGDHQGNHYTASYDEDGHPSMT